MADIQVYRLVPAATLVGLRDALQRAIFGNDVFVDQKERVFTVSAAGWLGYVDHAALAGRADPRSLPREREQALRAAEQFLDGVNGRTQAFNQATRAGLRSLLPDRNQRQLDSCGLVIRPGRPGADHWLCRYSIRLEAGTASAASVPVYGMSLELRIGARGAVVGFTSQWRPTLRTTYAELYPYERFASLLEDPEHHDGGEDPDAGRLLYVYDGAAGSQYYLAPYYYRVSDDHLLLSPASRYSLVVKVLEEDAPEGTRVVGRVYGGSGAYSFNWAYWNLDTAWRKNEPLVELGEGEVSRDRDEAGALTQSSLVLPRSHYTVLLNVTDERSGAYRHHQQAVYSRPRTASDANV
jgi:hypothetical protein